jgi:Domain of unknown function (DUF4390)
MLIKTARGVLKLLPSPSMRSLLAHVGMLLPRLAQTRTTWILTLLLAGVTVQAQDSVRIVPLVRDGQVLVTFELPDGYTEDVRAAIQSGLRTTFTYTVDLRVEVPAWTDRTIQTVTVNSIAKYDNLTRRHSIERTLDGRVESSKVTDDEAVVRQFMTGFQRLPLFRTSKLEANREYYVRVRATARPSSGSMLWPFGTGVTGLAKFTFIP